MEDEEEDLDEKMMLEEIDYIRKSIKIIDSECIMLKKDHERVNIINYLKKICIYIYVIIIYLVS